ncbi:MAG: cation diffusion facilitator family transporter, partial [Bdellovibrionota bacterium]
MSSIHDHDADDHDHSKHRHPLPRDAASHALKQALFISLVFMVLELLGGIYANSLALTGDAFHMLTDVGAVLLSFFALWISRRPASSSMTWGYHRAEILGALASGLAIWGIAAALIYGSILRLQAPPEVHGAVVFWIALVGL